jgi:putative phosphoribosyl transferase
MEEIDMSTPLFTNRKRAGEALAAALGAYADRADVLVLALPRGGVPVGFQVAQALHAPLDVFIVRKLGVPGHPEYAMGAIASGGVRVLNEEVKRQLRIPDAAVEEVARAELKELQRREHLYRADRPPPDVRGRTVLIVDDGLATGSTMLAAVRALRVQQPARIVVAVPVAAPDTCEAVGREADEMVCANTPDPFIAVGLWYADFAQTTDREVQELLTRARSDAAAHGVQENGRTG